MLGAVDPRVIKVIKLIREYKDCPDEICSIKVAFEIHQLYVESEPCAQRRYSEKEKKKEAENAYKAGRQVGRKDIIEWVEGNSSRDSFTPLDGKVYKLRTILEEVLEDLKKQVA